jgi:hypothetical protein
MKHLNLGAIGLLLAVLIVVSMSGCAERNQGVVPMSASGVAMSTPKVKPVEDNKTVEQLLLNMKLDRDNRPGVQKYIYMIGQNGQICMQDVVLYKIVSSGKRLTPRTIVDTYPNYYPISDNNFNGIPFLLNGRIAVTQEAVEEDGTFGDSGQYFFYFTTAGNYVKIIPAGTFIIVESDKPLTPAELTFMHTGVAN